MSTTYLIDFENVHESGLKGLAALPEDDTVIIFYTNNANRICFDALEGMKARMRTVHVEAGPQSLDMHLISYLGYLVGTEGSADNSYVIVSMDLDYTPVLAYWQNQFSLPGKFVGRPAIEERVSDRNDTIHYVDDGQGGLQTGKEMIRRKIEQIMRDVGERDAWGCIRVQFSLLCSKLNGFGPYVKEKKLSGKKPQPFLEEGFPDQIRLGSENHVLYAYAVQMNDDYLPGDELAGRAGILSSPSVSPAESIPAADQAASKPDLKGDCTPVCDQEPDSNARSDDLQARLTAQGITGEHAQVVAFLIHEAQAAQRPRVILYNALRKGFGNDVGTRYYKETRELLA